MGPIDYARITADSNDPTVTQCMKCRGKIFDAEKMVSRFGNFHKPCFRSVQTMLQVSTNSVSAQNTANFSISDLKSGFI